MISLKKSKQKTIRKISNIAVNRDRSYKKVRKQGWHLYTHADTVVGI